MRNLILRCFNRFLSTSFYDRLHRLLFGDLEHRFFQINQYNIATAKLHEKTFSLFKNKYNGRDVVIVACGPSTSQYHPIEGAIHIGVNKAYKFGQIALDYLFVDDGGPALQEMHSEIRAYRQCQCIKLFGIHSPHVAAKGLAISEQDAILSNALRFRLDNFCNFRGFTSHFAYDLCSEALGAYGSTVFPALQFALWTNPRRIFLVGCDCTEKGHFYARNENTWLHIPDLLKGYADLKAFTALYYPRTEIISVNPVGLRGLFRDWDQDKGPLDD